MVPQIPQREKEAVNFEFFLGIPDPAPGTVNRATVKGSQLTTPLFEEIATEMTEEEIRISESTPNYRFGAPSCAVPTPAVDGDPPPTEETESFIDDVLADPEQPVVMFSLEWCEFCWSVRRMFAAFKIPYRSVDLDSVEYQKDDRGGKIRAALAARTSMSTIPQVFVGGEFVGGCTEVFDSHKEGRLQKLLANCRVEYDRNVDIDPYSCLPTWLHPR